VTPPPLATGARRGTPEVGTMSRSSPELRDQRSLAAVSAPPPPSLSLQEVLSDAVGWQPEAEAVIGLSVPAGGKTQGLARRGAQVATVYRVLRDALCQLPDSPARAEADQLLNFHHQLLQQALLLAFRPDSPERERVAAHCRGGLGDAGLRLRLLKWRTAGPGR
jgi:hypothetical protein